MLNVWFGQFNIVAGQIQEEGPYVGVFEGARGAAGVYLYTVVEPLGGATARLCDDVIETVARTFDVPAGELTTNLSAALGAAHQRVREWNRLHSGAVATLGISCLAMRGDEAFLAQCGPTLMVARVGGRLHVAAPAGDDGRRALGSGDRPTPVFTRFNLMPDDILLLMSSAADRLIDRGTLNSMVTAPPDETLPALYLRVRSCDQFGALYLAVIDGVTGGASVNGVHRRSDSDDQEQRHPSPPGRGAGATGPRHIDRTDHRPPGPRTAAFTERASHQAKAATRAALGVLGEQRRLPSRRMLIILAACVAVLVLLWLAVPALARRGTEDRYAELLTGVDTTLAAARDEPDPGRRRQLLNRAEADLLDARTIRPDATEIDQRAGQISQEIAILDGARELTDLTVLTDLSTLGVAPQSTIELVIADKLYLLDLTSGKVLAFSGVAGEKPESVFDEGRPTDAERTAKARHIAPAPPSSGSLGVMLVLDANRRLFALSADGTIRQVALAAAETWKSDTAIAVAPSALYVLDAAAQQVWRYNSTPTGYSERPEPLLTRAGLKSAASISVSGVPVVATTDSRLLRLVEGREEELRPVAIDRPLLAPTAPQFNPVDGLLYIADRGNQRVVKLDATGRFQGQLTSGKLTALRALALDEARGILYAVNGQSLMVAPLPK